MPPPVTFDPYTILQVLPTAEQAVIRGAFRGLAFKYHPDRDQTARAVSKMAEINRAYALLRDETARAAFDRNRRSMVGGVSGQPIVPPPSSRSADGSSVLQFGRYTGWTLRDLARRDTDYLLWLSRHSSGIRYRAEIYALLSAMGIKANT